MFLFAHLHSFEAGARSISSLYIHAELKFRFHVYLALHSLSKLVSGKEYPQLIISGMRESSSFAEPHAPAYLPRERLFQVPLTRQAAGRLSEHGRRDAAALDGAAEHEDGVA